MNKTMYLIIALVAVLFLVVGYQQYQLYKFKETENNLNKLLIVARNNKELIKTDYSINGINGIITYYTDVRLINDYTDFKWRYLGD